MRWLFSQIASGFAWTLGSRAAHDAYDDVTTESEPEHATPVESPQEAARRREAEAKAAKAAKKKLEREIDDDLRALKKRVEREARRK